MKKTKLIALALSAMAASVLAACGTAQQDIVPEINEIGEGLVAHQDGIQIRRLSNGTDTDGKPYFIVGYSLTPANTTHTDFTVGVTFQDQNASGSPTDYVTATIDLNAKTVKIKKIADFDEVILVTITDDLDSTKTATVEVHLKEKFTGWNDSHTHWDNTIFKFRESAQTSNYKWDGAKKFANQMLSFSSTFTDAMTASEKTIEDVSYTVSSAKWYAASVANYAENNSTHKYSGTLTRGTFIADGSAQTAQGEYGITKYGSANPAFSNVLTANPVQALAVDVDSWTGAQRDAAYNSDYLALVVSISAKWSLDDVESPIYSGDLTFVLEKASYENFVAIPLQSVSIETPTVTF